MYKNQLQELAQRSCFNLPSYSCIREGPDHAPRFKARVNFSGEIFESPTFCTTLRQAEHAAAEVALKTLSARGPSRILAARVLDETGVYKNLLQETAHRAGLKLPVYTTVRSGPGHVPVFTCTVQIAGMSFIGEPAKTKKQAQKSAAMASWFALKKSSQTGSSSSPLLEFGGKDEQEQVTVARYLSSLQSPLTNKLIQRDWHHEQHSLAPVRRDVIPCSVGRSLYSLQCQNHVYAHFSPEVAMYQNWPQERVSQPQSYLLALPTVSTSIPRQFFPFARSIFQPDYGPYFFAREQESVPLVPGIGPFLYFSNHLMPVPVRINSQVTIQEIEDNTQVQQEWLDKDDNSGCWKVNFPSNASGLSPTEVSNHPDYLGSPSNLRIQELLPEKDKEKNSRFAPDPTNSYQHDIYWNEEFSRIPPGFTRNRPGVTSADEARSRPQVWSNVRSPNPPIASSHRFSRGSLPPRFAAPATVRTAGFRSPGSRVAEGSNRFMPASTPARTAVSACSTRPLLGGPKNFGGTPCASSMAPAVQIRSVVPVCSAAPARRTAPPTPEGIFREAERKRTKEAAIDISGASSEFDQLRI